MDDDTPGSQEAFCDEGIEASQSSGVMVALQFPVLRGNELLNWQALANVTVNLLGVAILALPYAMAEAGPLFGLFALPVAVKSSYSTWKMLVELSAFDGTIAGRLSYPEIGRRVLGSEGHLAVLVSYVLYSGGLLVCQLSALSDILFIFLPEWQGWTLWFAMFLACPGVCWPTPPSGKLFAVTCIGGVFALIVTLLTVSADIGGEVGPKADFDFGMPSFTGLLNGLAIFVAQFSAHCSFEVTTSIFDAEEDFGGVLVNFAHAYTFAFGVSLALAMAGYVHFGHNIQSNVLLSWSSVKSTQPVMQWFQVTQAVYILVLLVGTSLSARPCVASLQEIFGASRRGFTGPSHSPQKALPVLLGCGAVSWLQGTRSSGLGSSLKWLGAFGASPLVLLLPPLFYVEMARRQGGRPMLSPENATALIPAALGLLLTISAIFEIVSSSMSSPAGHRGDRTAVSLTNITASRWR